MSKAQEFRLKCRSGSHSTHTSGFCSGYAQGNLIVLPAEVSQDFEDLCLRNPVACPLIAKTPKGDPYRVDDRSVLDCADLNIATDIPQYLIYENGEVIETKDNIESEWTKNHVGFIIGCSFSFENALTRENLAPKNQKMKKNVSMYITNKLLDTSGIFVNCPYVVSMRPYKANEIEKVRAISREFRKTHGEPIDWGYEAVDRLGIKDIDKPDFGDSITIDEDEIPVFWGCGVTPQIAAKLSSSKIKGKFMAHKPGHMLILDVKDDEVTTL